MLNAIKTNPVRLYAIATAALALVAYYVPDLPTVLILALVAAILGVGETVRAAVTPNSRVVIGEADLPRILEGLGFPVPGEETPEVQ
jgi:hypothetical protein